jgi:ribosome-associated toxin RatA of RatAB toxin-antitoxin module
MITLNRSALVGHEAEAMYRLVTDIEAYPLFLPWCRRATIHESRADYVRATLGIDFRGVRQEFTTENRNEPVQRVQMRLIDGPFKSLAGEWRFVPLAADACKVELDLAYEFASPLLERLVGPVFNHIANTLVDAFIRRADSAAGKP